MNRAIIDLDRRHADRSAQRDLAIRLSPVIEAPSENHALLIAFHFGAPLDSPGPAVVSPGLVPVDGSDLYECWWYNGPVEHRTIGDVSVAECDDYAIVALQRSDVQPDRIRALTQKSYLDLLNALGTTAHPHIGKIWNYFPEINEGDGDLEKYRQFSIGRAEAFEQTGILDSTVPCGTAVGSTAGNQLSIVALASKHGFLATENPRQVSAYAYPKRYGPRSPKFSRGGRIASANHCLFVLSGTAAIVGHESAHPYQTRRQIDETLANLEHLSRALSAGTRESGELVLDRDSVLRVYLRDPEDFEQVADRLAAGLSSGGTEPGTGHVAFLRGDICRHELMVEIDGIKVV